MTVLIHKELSIQRWNTHGVVPHIPVHLSKSNTDMDTDTRVEVK